MSKIIREVGFLALGLVAVLEVCMHGRIWAWNDHVLGGVLAALFVLLQGAYFALDGLAWGFLWEHVGKLAAPPTLQPQPKQFFENKLAKHDSKGWRIDFAALILGAAALGIGAQLLATFEHYDLNLTPKQLADLPGHQASILVAAGLCLTLMFFLTAVYWNYLDAERQINPTDTKAFFDACAEVWKHSDKPYLLKWAFCVPVLLSGGLT